MCITISETLKKDTQICIEFATECISVKSSFWWNSENVQKFAYNYHKHATFDVKLCLNVAF